MSTNNKYTTNQRKIVWNIRTLKNRQKSARSKWLMLDIKINQLNEQLSRKW